MIAQRILVVLAFLGMAGGCAIARLPEEPGMGVLSAAFDPERTFAGDLRESTDDELVLTVWASARDDYAPAYNLAIAFRCLPSGPAGEWQCGYQARMLRVAPTISEGTGESLGLYWQAKEAQSASDMRGRLDRAGLQWLEADVNACPKGIFAMDSIRIADWRPDIHYALQEREDREVIMHPAEIRVMMHGSYTRSTYEGWVLANGVPAAVRTLIETLEPCWKPGTSPLPWRRPAN